MKILELSNYSAGICGVWARVREESLRLSDLGHEVRVFSSDLIKGRENGPRAPSDDMIGKVKIRRFPAKKMPFAESYMVWAKQGLKKEMIDFRPDVIIAHSYRHTHTVVAARVANRIGARSLLVTHAPFGDVSRNWLARNYIRFFHDPFVGRPVLKDFSMILPITRWELPYLKRLGVSRDKIRYIPNGVPEEFFTQKKGKESRKILFLGRISPVKDLETLIMALASVKDKKVVLEVVGPAENDYLARLKRLISSLGLEKRVLISPPIFDIHQKIKKIDSAQIFVLPSKRESMPQALIEAMARERIVIASSNLGSKELISDGKNGFIFQVGDYKGLAEKIDLSLRKANDPMKKEARRSVEQFSWDKVVRQLDAIISGTKRDRK